MPQPIVQILADGESGRTVTFRGQQVMFSHSIYTRMNDTIVGLRDRVDRSIDGPVQELASPDASVRSRALTDLLTWTAPPLAVRLCGQAASMLLTMLSSGLCDRHHRLNGANNASRA